MVFNKVRYCYNAVNFLPNPPQRYTIAPRLGQGMGCNLWFDTRSYILLQSTQCCMKYCVILERVIMTLYCIQFIWVSSFRGRIIKITSWPMNNGDKATAHFIWMIHRFNISHWKRFEVIMLSLCQGIRIKSKCNFYILHEIQEMTNTIKSTILWYGTTVTLYRK